MKTPARLARNLFSSLAVLMIAGVGLSSPAMAQPFGVVSDRETENATVNVFDVGTNSVVASIPIDSNALFDVVIAPDQTLAFVSTFSQNVWVIDLTTSPPSLASGNPINPISISTSALDLAVTPDGRFLLATDGFTGGDPHPISIVDIANRTEVGIFSTGRNNIAVDICDDGTSVLVLTEVDTAYEVRRLTINPNGTLTDTDESLSLGTIENNSANNVNCAPGSRTGVVKIGRAHV